MKKMLLSLVNILIIGGIVVFVILYSRFDRKRDYNNQITNFENMTVAMEAITENYLEGEQSICDVWATYINTEHMTLNEATSFIRSSHVLENTSAHLIDATTLKGFSTRKSIIKDDYVAEYDKIDIFGDMQWIAPIGEKINLSRAYTNPVNGEQSLAFINWITVYDEATDEAKSALLLRIVPVSVLEEKWVFPQQEFEDAELAIINISGEYIIRGNAYKSTNFYEFYRSWNEISNTDFEKIKQEVITETGNFSMINSKKEEAIIAHTPVVNSNGWIMLNYIQSSKISSQKADWLIISVITGGLLFLLIINTVYMRFFNKRLQQMTVAAESANRAKTNFLSTMSHDIRTPMNAIIGLTAISEKRVEDHKLIKENLHKINLASNHLLTLINDVLDISKVESGKLNLNPLNVSLVELIDTLVNISHPMIKEKNIDSNFRVNKVDEEYLYADEIRLNQIFINLLSNAIKYTEPGGSVSVDLKEERSEKKGYVTLIFVVSDTGMGMSPEYMKTMYQPFSRQVDSRVNSIQGTGLGLAITKSMVDQMNGTIDCVSELGKGTTFTVTLELPIADKSLEDISLGPVDVLIVDDDEVLLDTAMETLESLGAHADRAEDGASAIEKVKAKKDEGKMYDVIILDWKMAGMDGIETSREIRKVAGSEIPILLASAYDYSEVEGATKDATINGFISKPLFRTTLYTKINELLDKEVATTEVEDDYSDIAGMKALIAEDNEINWEIINALLEMYGVDSERAENGEVCVERLKNAKVDDFDFVFMDIQMPIMNGLDATRAIRKLDDKDIANIPIIAMTADAFSENVAECMNAGMNGHIAKPIDIKLVIKEIRRIKERRK